MERVERFLFKTLSVRTLGALYVGNFLLALHGFLVVYINSSYLSTLIPERSVGLVFMGGGLLGIGTFLFISRILERFGNVRTLTVLVLLEFLIFLGLAFPGHRMIALALFALYAALYPLVLFTLDIFLENYTGKENTTGRIRGTFLTTTNAALFVAPIMAGFILGGENYWRVFVTSAILLIPFLIIMLRRYGHFRDPEYRPLQFRPMLKLLRSNQDILLISKAHLIMRLFFSWMVIYTPIYLHNHLGFEWPTIGIIFTIMLLPYLLLELPAGKIADSWLGEKELLSAGFVITALFVGMIFFMGSAGAVLWAGLLFVTRVGAALIEITTETYFFKHVDGDDANLISIFRMIRPVAYILGPLIGTAALFFIDIQYIFLVFAVIILYGLRYSLALKDTR